MTGRSFQFLQNAFHALISSIFVAVRIYLNHSRLFLMGYLLFLLGGLAIRFSFPKGFVVLTLNKLHSPALDMFFKYFTHLGDGIFVVALLLLGFFFIHKNFAIKGAILSATVALVTQFLKRQIFGWPRPKAVLGDLYHFVDGVQVHSNFSFPSGHTSAAFCLYTVLLFYTRNKALRVVWLVVAIMVGVSRMYLFQHFLEDVLVGSMLGVAITFFGHYALTQKTRLNLKDSKFELL